MRTRRAVGPVVVVCAVLAACLVWACVPAFAAAPEAPLMESAVAQGSTVVTLKGELSPNGATGPLTYQFDYNTNGTCTGAQSTPAVEVAEGKQDHVQAEARELEPNRQYTFCLIATNAENARASSNEISAQTGRQAPTVSGESFSDVGPTGATLAAQVNMENQEGHYYFKYGTSAEFATGTAKATAGETLAPNGSPVAVSARLAELQPATEYHYRLIVANVTNEASEGAETTFSTLPESGAVPDKRIDEMVTPPDNLDADVYVPFSSSPGANFTEGYYTRWGYQVATDGNKVVYEAEPTINGGGESAGNGIGSAYLATRSPQGGWTQISIQPPGRRNTHYAGFSSDLSIGVLHAATEETGYEEGQLPGPPGPSAPSQEYGYEDLYLTTLGHEYYDPLVTNVPRNRTVTDISEEFGRSFVGDFGNRKGGPIYAGGSADMSQLLFLGNDALLEGEGSIEKELDQDAKNEIARQEDNEYLYDWSAGELHLVDLLPEDKGVAPNAIFGATQESQPNNPPDFSKVISTDGSRVFWSTLEANHEPTALYVRENADQPQSPLNGHGECENPADGCTVEVDKAVGGGGRYWAASSDGSKVFFTKGDLYEYDVNTAVTSDLTPGVEVQGVLGAGQTGDYVYYVDAADKLYVLHESGGVWQAPVAIATLNSGDGHEVAPYESEVGDWQPDLGQRTAQVTSDGRALVFMSSQSLAVQGFPNGAPTNPGQYQVYVYHATDNSLFCASCNQSGEPTGGAYLPVSWSDSHMQTWISEDGDEVFFDTGAALLPQDTDGLQDVYEWEREGTGGCAAGTGLRGGCIYLLSGGKSIGASWLIGASANGSNVFLITRAQLTPEDPNENDNVFDARAEGVQPLNPPECTGTGCQGLPGAPPVFATPSSVTFAGVGNFEPAAPTKAAVKAKAKPLTRAQKLKAALRACKKQKRKPKRESCEARARKHYGSKKTKNSAKGR